MDAGAIMQNDTSIENLRVMTEVCRELGVYSAGSFSRRPTLHRPIFRPRGPHASGSVSVSVHRPRRRRASASLDGEGQGTAGDHRRSRTRAADWDEIEGLANGYIWQLLLSF